MSPYFFQQSPLTEQLNILDIPPHVLMLCLHVFPWTPANLPTWHKDTIRTDRVDIIYLWTSVIRRSAYKPRRDYCIKQG